MTATMTVTLPATEITYASLGNKKGREAALSALRQMAETDGITVETEHASDEIVVRLIQGPLYAVIFLRKFRGSKSFGAHWNARFGHDATFPIPFSGAQNVNEFHRRKATLYAQNWTAFVAHLRSGFHQLREGT